MGRRKRREMGKRQEMGRGKRREMVRSKSREMVRRREMGRREMGRTVGGRRWVGVRAGRWVQEQVLKLELVLKLERFSGYSMVDPVHELLSTGRAGKKITELTD
ncbi:hypothetical protein Bbelb_342730 [Branchiostoma belcheri]|nr:hypothetical protein Bbelb_342730 [Branchiostoma belcheri]